MNNRPISRLGVIGDVHAEDKRLASAIRFLEKLGVDDMVCTGDIVDGIGCPETCIAELIDADVKTVRGNHDRWIIENKARHIPDAHFWEEQSDQTRQYLESLPSQIDITTVQGELKLCHGIEDDDLRKVWPGTERMGIERSKRLDTLIDAGKHRFVINGHMHFRTIIHFKLLTLINAGTLKGEHWPGFSLIDFATGHVEAFGFDQAQIEVIAAKPLGLDSDPLWTNTQDFAGGWEPVRLF